MIYELMTIAKNIYEIMTATAFSLLPEKESQVCTHYAQLRARVCVCVYVQVYAETRVRTHTIPVGHRSTSGVHGGANL